MRSKAQTTFVHHIRRAPRKERPPAMTFAPDFDDKLTHAILLQAVCSGKRTKNNATCAANDPSTASGRR